jgi:predicted PurR-regulated permease PerM
MPGQAEISNEEGGLHLRRAVAASRADAERRNGNGGRAGDNAVSDEDDAIPVQIWPAFLSIATQIATVGIFLFALFLFLDQARPILVPLVSAVVIGWMLGPLHGFIGRYLPSWASALLLTLLFILLVNGVITLMAAPVIDWIGKAPEIGKTLQEKLHILDAPLASLRELQNAIVSQSGDAGALKVTTGPNILAPALGIVTPAIGQLLLFIGTLFFFLLGRDEMRRYLVSFFHKRDGRLTMLRILNEIEHNLTRYLSIVAVIYFGMGCLTGVTAWIVGLPNPAVWGILAFVLNFVPYIGPSIMVVVLTGVGLITFPTMVHAFVAPAVYLGLATLEGHFVTPSIVGRTLTMNPLMVFLALAFWTYIWGPVGAFLATPLLIVTMVGLHHIRPKNEVNLPG